MAQWLRWPACAQASLGSLPTGTLNESLVAAGRASRQNCSRAPVQVLPW